MSTSANMLRTRRKDTNVKPNRRLDRKSSRGMIFENEELRLKTININAEVERGQNDIKKLKRENDQLRREIWYLRDEYERLDKLLRTKQTQCISSSSTSCSSDSESCSSCTEETDEIEMSQNLANVQKTSLSNFHKEFDHLSVVPEENSAENSEQNSSNRASLSNDPWDKNVIKADQSYPFYENISAGKEATDNVYGQIAPSHSYEDTSNNQFLGLEQSHFPLAENDQLHLNLCVGQNLKNALQSRTLPKDTLSTQNFFDNPPPLVRQDAITEKLFSIKPDIRYYENLPFYNNELNHFANLENINTLPVMRKTGTDLIAKTDNTNFNTLTSHSSFSNGGNLEELLNDIETISQDILKISNIQKRTNENEFENNENENYNEPLNIEDINLHVQQNHTNIQAENGRINSTDTQDSSYKSQLNLIVMPTPMPLIGIEKYRNLQRSCESIRSQSLENLSASKTDLKILDETEQRTAIIDPDQLKSDNRHSCIPIPQMCSSPISDRTPRRKNGNIVPVPPICPESPNIRPKIPDTPSRTLKFPFPSQSPNPGQQNRTSTALTPQSDVVSKSPFPFGHYENKGYNSENSQDEMNSIKLCPLSMDCASKDVNLKPSSCFDRITSENEENLKFDALPSDKGEETQINKEKESRNGDLRLLDTSKPSKLSIRRKVSIHFKGKKDKNLAQKNLEAGSTGKDDLKTSSTEKKVPFIDIKFHTEVKSDKKPASKSPIPDRKLSNVESKATRTSIDSKCSAGDNKNSICESKSSNSDPKTSGTEQKSSTPNGDLKEAKALDQKLRKSISVSPEHGKHKHSKGDGKKCHKKHKKGGDRMRYRRSSLTTDRFLRERSFSVCTDRSNILDHRLGLGYGFGFYDDLSDKDSSVSSCDSNVSKSRKISMLSNIPSAGKIPWCGCWGNGCM